MVWCLFYCVSACVGHAGVVDVQVVAHVFVMFDCTWVVQSWCCRLWWCGGLSVAFMLRESWGGVVGRYTEHDYWQFVRLNVVKAGRLGCVFLSGFNWLRYEG